MPIFEMMRKSLLASLGAAVVTKEKVESVIFNAAVMVGPDGELLGEYLHPQRLRGDSGATSRRNPRRRALGSRDPQRQ